jgi:hypothetical protein
VLDGNMKIKRKREALLDAGEEVGLDVKAKKYEYTYTFLFRQQSTEQNRYTQAVNKRWKKKIYENKGNK